MTAPRLNDEQQLDPKLRAFLDDLAKFCVDLHLAGHAPGDLRPPADPVQPSAP